MPSKLHPLPINLKAVPVELSLLTLSDCLEESRHQGRVLLLLSLREDLKDGDPSALEPVPAMDNIIGCCVVGDLKEDRRAPTEDIHDIMVNEVMLLKEIPDPLVKGPWLADLCERMRGGDAKTEDLCELLRLHIEPPSTSLLPRRRGRVLRKGGGLS